MAITLRGSNLYIKNNQFPEKLNANKSLAIAFSSCYYTSTYNNNNISAFVIHGMIVKMSFQSNAHAIHETHTTTQKQKD